jgi:hypothetical protein
MGDKTYGATGMVWSTLDQGALSLSYTKMNFKKGKLQSISSYSNTNAYLKGTLMTMLGYTWVKPHPKWGVVGVSVGAIGLFVPEHLNQTLTDTAEIRQWLVEHHASVNILPDTIHNTATIYHASLATSAVAFWMHPPIAVNERITVAPQIFVMGSPLSYNSITGFSTNQTIGTMMGTSLDYKITKRFGVSSAWRVMMAPNTKSLNYLMIGSRIML